MNELDLGSGFSLRWTSWAPDRELNPQYDDLPDIEKFGALLTCKHGLEGGLTFEHEKSYERIFPDAPRWKVLSWEPLTLTPSIQTGCCHGYIREGKWIEA